jgi:hypothetical protein
LWLSYPFLGKEGYLYIYICAYIYEDDDKRGWAQWFSPVIPVAQEAEIDRITIQGQPRQKVIETSYQPTS